MIDDPLYLPDELPLPPTMGAPGANYVLEADMKEALRFAWVRRRPLLVVGEAGIGKSQLAAALAKAWQLPLLSHVVQSNTQAEDLLWRFDAVQRLAEAQVARVADTTAEAVTEQLSPTRFIRPGVLWWAWAWGDLQGRLALGTLRATEPAAPEGWNPQHGSVVLIDEIDKASADVPNSLLDVMESGEFELPWTGERIGSRQVRANQIEAPFIIITSNGERDLPAAFLRRCFVLRLKFGGPEAAHWLTLRGRAHFSKSALHDDVLKAAAAQVLMDRASAAGRHEYKPGVSEYLDLLYGVKSLAKGKVAQAALLTSLGQFVRKAQAQANAADGDLA